MYRVNEKPLGGIIVVIVCLATVASAHTKTAWLETDKLLAFDGEAGDYFGTTVSVSGDYCIVGAYRDDSRTGAAYIYRREGTSWLHKDKLTAPDAANDDYFGWSVSISGDYCIVGAYGDDDNGSNTGSAYIFKASDVPDDPNWYYQAKLTAFDAASEDRFGYAVSIDGDYAAIGAWLDDDNGSGSGSAYTFKRSGENWNYQTKLTAPDATYEDYFGHSVSISGDYIISGAFGDDPTSEHSGSAYIFARTGESWNYQDKLTAPDGGYNDEFGRAVSISGGYAIIGAHYDDANGNDSGSAYIFKRDSENWDYQDKLIASDAAVGDNFGTSVSISGDQAIATAPEDDDYGASSGSAYIFKRNGTSWTERAKLTPADGSTTDRFGASASISGDYAVAGAFGDDDNGASSGSAYMFEELICPTADLDDDCFVDFNDFGIMAAQWLQNGRSCETGFADCDSSSANGCETNIYADVNNCGSCGNNCLSLPHVYQASCDKGRCNVSSCYSGYDNCDGLGTNGCEVSTDNDVYNCGSCGKVCNLPHAQQACIAGDCAIGGCDSGYGNCDGNIANGCETNTNTNAYNCGSCGNICNLPHAQEACIAGDCAISSCDYGWCNQNGYPNDGCERNLDTNPNCNPFTSLGTVRGDVGFDSVSHSTNGERWFRVYVSEADESILDCEDLTAAIKLYPAGGTDYDLYVYCDSCGSLAGSSTNRGSAMDEVRVRWEEDCIMGFPTGTDSGRYISILVRYYSANICNDYNLYVYGNASAGSKTCSTK